MINKDKTEKRKDIDDVLSSIDSLLDTATDVSSDDLPILEIEPEKTADKFQPQEKVEKVIANKKVSPTIKKKTKISGSKTSKATKSKTTEKKESTASQTTKAKKEQPQATDKPKEAIVSNQATKTETEATVTDPISMEAKELFVEKPESTKTQPKETDPVQKPELKQDVSSIKTTDFSSTQKELPVLDEIITEEEMALIAAGKELPKRVITEKFAPKSTTDKIFDVMGIQLADYNITRLEYEYIHELIDEILVEESTKKSK